MRYFLPPWLEMDKGVKGMTLFASQAIARNMILKVSAWMNERGYLSANDGNISCRIAQDVFLTVAAGVYKGYIDEDMIIKMNTDGRVMNAFGCYTPSADTGMHVRIFRQYPMVFGVINGQPPYATLCSLISKPLEEALLPATVKHLGVVPVAAYAAPGSGELEDTVEQNCKGHNALLLANRGLLAWGANLFEAWQRFETAEQYARMTWSLEGREKHTLTQAETAALVKEREDRYSLLTGGVPRGGDK
jgi:L-fuculose-phosphate aldolase